jgi:nucleoside-diphosphate-sugar epimerase
MAGQYAAQGMQVIRVRPFNHIGPGQRSDFVVPAFASQIARIEVGRQEPILKVGNLEAQRDFLDVRDVVRAYLLALEQIESLDPGLILNICSGNPKKISELLQGLLNHTDCDIKIEEDPDRMRPSEIPLAAGDSTAVSACLDWQPRIPLDKTLGEILTYWRNKIA